jgi:hypothetical protein
MLQDTEREGGSKEERRLENEDGGVRGTYTDRSAIEEEGTQDKEETLNNNLNTCRLKFWKQSYCKADRSVFCVI